MTNAFCVIMMTVVKIYDFHTKSSTSIFCHTQLTLEHAHFQGVQVNVTNNLGCAYDILCNLDNRFHSNTLLKHILLSDQRHARQCLSTIKLDARCIFMKIFLKFNIFSNINCSSLTYQGDHVVFPYSRCGLTKLLKRLLNISSSMELKERLIIPHCRFALFETIDC